MLLVHSVCYFQGVVEGKMISGFSSSYFSVLFVLNINVVKINPANKPAEQLILIMKVTS